MTTNNEDPADQMRETIAAERERQTTPPTWWTCPTHGDAQPNAWGCPECAREMRDELAALRLLVRELLDALQDILTVVRMAECYDEYKAAEAAIAKALQAPPNVF